MQNQYLVVAENITYKNNKLSCINIFDQFVAVKLPAEFTFDLAVICGPGWEPGKYNVKIQAKTTETDLASVGNLEVDIPHDNFVYNALAPNLKITLGPNVKSITFVVSKNDDVVIKRNYPVSALLTATVAPTQEQPKEEKPQEG